MPTATGHTRAIPASKVSGTDVYNTAGERIGQVQDIVLDKMSSNVMFAVLGFGGFLGIGEKYHAMPWSMLDYDEEGTVRGKSACRRSGRGYPQWHEQRPHFPVFQDFARDHPPGGHDVCPLPAVAAERRGPAP